MLDLGKHLYDAVSYSGVGALSALSGIIIGIYLMLLVFVVLIFVFLYIGKWKVLTKAGQPGWAALIPFYSDYCLCKICGVNVWWVLIFAIANVCYSGCNNSKGSLSSLVGILFLVIIIYYAIILNVSIAKSFGKSDGYAVGLILLQPFFYFALGIGNDKYLGVKPCKDPVMEFFVKKDSNPNTNNNSETNFSSESSSSENKEFCSECGAQIDSDSNFCMKCGKKR